MCCRILLLVIYVRFNGLITSDGEDRANLSAIVYLYICGFYSEGVSSFC